MGILRAAVLVAGLSASAPAMAERDVVEPSSTRAAAFDQAFARVVGPESLDMSGDGYDAELERLRALLPAGDLAREVRFRSVYCGSRSWKDAERGLAYSDDALRRARDARDLASEARAILCRTAYIMLTSGSRHGLPEVEKAIALLEDSREQQLLAESLEFRGDIHSLIGEQAKAMLDFQRARAAYRAAGISGEVELLMLSIAVAYRRMGDWTQAERYFTGAIDRMRDKGDWEAVSTNMVQLGFLHLESGAPDKALDAFRQAEAIAGRQRSAYNLNAARMGVAESQIALGDPASALAMLERARAGFAAERDQSNEDMLLMLTGQALARQGRHAEALQRYARALPLVTRNGNDRYLAILYKAKAASEEALGNIAVALADHKRHYDLQMKLQGKMRLEQGRMLEYEYETHRREFENRRLRADAEARDAHVAVLERVRRWQTLTIVLAGLLLSLLGWLAWRQGARSRRLREMTLLDPLTGAASRIGVEDEASRALADVAASGAPLSVLMLDLDHFKTVNDRFGHGAGDKVLRAAVDAWQAQLRGRDVIGRIGGEEFVVVCPETDLEQAIAAAERLRLSTHSLTFPEIDPSLQVTVSVGVAQARRDDTRDGLLDRADAALYRAKQQGRDRTAC